MPFPRSSPVRLLILAGVIHIALTTSIFLLGRYHLLPGTFDENGIGLTFAVDGTSYQKSATLIVADWHTYGFVVWLRAKAPFHSRVYAVAFAILGRLLGHNILAAEPLNLFYYLGILTCVYVLGREIFNPRTGLIAAVIVGAWPSFLLHSTQLIRDPLAILCLLGLMIVLILLLTREFGWSRAIAVGIAGAMLATLFWITRGNMWNIVLVAITAGLAMLVQRMIREKKLLPGNMIVMLWIIAAALLVPARLESSTLPGVRPPTTPLSIPLSSEQTHSQGVWTRSIKQIADRRAGFRFATSRASDVDADVRFGGVTDIVKYIPRAAVIGFFAPFPNMWVRAGNFGFAVRLLSGLETLVMYFLYLAAAFGVWQERRNAKMWLLFLVATIGIVALGLVVVNAGALYRIRYVFWMMLIVIAVEGIRKLAHLTVFRTNATKS
jgi:4-amino-4-deoxy-L-arabinose transferase-like glycosyltransferase